MNKQAFKEQVKEVLINEIRNDINTDWTVLDDLLNRLPLKTLINALSDKEMEKFNKINLEK